MLYKDYVERKGISCSPPVALRDTKGTHAAMAELKLIRSGWMDQDAIPWLPVDAAGLLGCRTILLNCLIFSGYYKSSPGARSNHAKIQTKWLASFLRKVSFSFSLPNCTFSYGTLEGSRHNLGIWLCCFLDASEEFLWQRLSISTPTNIVLVDVSNHLLEFPSCWEEMTGTLNMDNYAVFPPRRRSNYPDTSDLCLQALRTSNSEDPMWPKSGRAISNVARNGHTTTTGEYWGYSPPVT